MRADATHVPGVAAAVEYRHLQPAEVGPEADAPDHAADARCLRVEFGAFGRGCPGRCVEAGRRRVDAVRGDVLVDAGVDAVVGGVGIVEVPAQVGCEAQAPVAVVLQHAIQFHALGGEAAQVDVASSVASGHVVVGVVAHAFAQGCSVTGRS